MAVLDTLLLIAPEFATVDSGVLTSIIALAELQVSSTAFGDKRELAVSYVAAHMLTLRDRNGAGGQIQSLKEGELSISYGANTNAKGYDLTSYGQEFNRLVRTTIIGARTTEC